MNYKPIGEIADVTKLAGFEFTKYIKYNDNGEIIALRALNLRNGHLDLKDIKRIDKKVSEQLTRSKLYANDILLTYTGNGYGDCAIIEENDKYHLAPNICKIAPNESVNPYYLYFVIKSDFFYQQMTNYIGGSGQPTIPMKTIRQLQVPFPPLETQHRIASILSSLDDKIELNNKINENLEQQAQAIYQSMFVSTHHETDRIGLLSELITVKYGKDHKKLNDGTFPVYGSGGIMRYVEKPLYEKESVLIPRKGSLNNVMYVDEPFWSVDTMFFTEMKLPNVAKFVFHFVKSKDLASLNAGSAVPSMTTDILNSMDVRIPSDERLAKFEGLVAPLYRTIKDNVHQSKRLSVLRDTLLPKLMNGEIDVSKVKIERS